MGTNLCVAWLMTILVFICVAVGEGEETGIIGFWDKVKIARRSLLVRFGRGTF